MVSGQKAFQGDTKMSTLAAIVKQEPKAISQLVSDVPPELEKIINRCLRKDPARRFQTMADLKVFLEELKHESDSGKLTGDNWHQFGTARRIWLWVGGAIVVATMAVAVWHFRRNPQQTTRCAGSRPSHQLSRLRSASPLFHLTATRWPSAGTEINVTTTISTSKTLLLEPNCA